MKTTLAIVTRRRPEKLKRCLISITEQKQLPAELIIIENDQEQLSKKIVDDFADRLSIKYFQEEIQSVPKARNLAMKKAKTRYLAFVDDDCVLDNNWLALAEKAISGSKAAYVVGRTKLFNLKKILALAQFQREKFWFKKSLKGNKANKNNVDTKNIILDLKILKKKKISFDEKAVVGPYDSADFSLGIQMEEENLFGLYEQRMLLWHEESSSLLRFIKRAFSRGRNSAFLAEKYLLENIFQRSEQKNIYTRFRDFFKDFAKEKEMYTNDIECSNLRKNLIVFLAKIYEYAFEAGYTSYQRKL
jgi:glycosyltransferase involved in cell wall biosynthesis